MNNQLSQRRIFNRLTIAANAAVASMNIGSMIFTPSIATKPKRTRKAKTTVVAKAPAKPRKRTKLVAA